MEICIRKENENQIYIDKTALNRFSKEELAQPPYNFTFIEVEKEDCEASDFNDDLTFNIEKYNARKLAESNAERIIEIKERLNELSQDFIQVQVGAEFDNLEERKAEFRNLHNELRVLLGKEPRIYNN